jgi:hypothetical protein
MMFDNDPAAVEWLEREANKTYRAFKLFRNFLDRDELGEPEDRFPQWLMDRLNREMRVVVQPMFRIKEDSEAHLIAISWSPRSRYTQAEDIYTQAPDDWEPEIL